MRATTAKTMLLAAALAVALPTASLMAQDNSGTDNTGQTVITGRQQKTQNQDQMEKKDGGMSNGMSNGMADEQMSPEQQKEAAKKFFMAQASGNQFEIEASQYALKNSDNPDVKKVAQTIITDHTAAQKLLREQAKDAGVEIPETPKLNDVNKDQLEMTKKEAKGVEFDQGYIYSQDAAHLEVALLLTHAEKSGPNSQVKAYASQVLPKVKEHHATLHTLANQMSGYNPNDAMTAGGKMNPNEGMDSQKMDMSEAEMKEQVSSFFKHSAEGGEYEVQTAKLALQKSQRIDVKQVAQTILDDHDKSQQLLKAQAKEAGVDLSDQTELSKLLSDKLAMLKEKQGGDFDRAYVFDLAAGNRAAVLYQGDARTELKQSQPVQTVVKQKIPEDEKHFDSLKPVASELAGGYDFNAVSDAKGAMNGMKKDMKQGMKDANPMNAKDADSTGKAANGPEDDKGGM